MKKIRTCTSGSRKGDKYPVTMSRQVRIRTKHEHRGALTKHGYDIWDDDATRHRALGKAIDEHGDDKVWHMLHAQVVYRKNARKNTREYYAKARFRNDKDWVQKQKEK